MANETFSVDTKVFRELGELLVGKNSTALAELIKNSYDADAQNVIISGRNLDDPERGVIQVVDDGVGMDARQFRAGFLTIAGREKGDGQARSRVFQRAFTGEKGVGRLAARKLGRHLQVETWPYNGEAPIDAELPATNIGVRATIDWEAVEQCRFLSEVEASGAVKVEEVQSAAAAPRAGTSITLTRFSSAWSTQDLGSFQLELLNLLPLPAVVGPLPSTFGGPLLFSSRLDRDVGTSAPFTVHYDGEFYAVDAPKAADPAAAPWVVEVDCDTSKGTIEYAVAPSASVVRRYEAVRQHVTVPIAPDEPSVSFKARIYEHERASWGPAARGIKVYLEGFRVLPYGDQYDDWLRIDEDYSDRQKSYLRRLADFDQWLPEGREKEELAGKRNSSYMGVVLLTRAGAPQLKTLVNREGFVPSPELTWLERRVRVAVDLMQRVRYAATSDLNSARKRYLAENRSRSERDLEQTPTVVALRDAASSATEKVGLAREALARGDVSAASSLLTEAEEPQGRVQSIILEMGTEQAMYRILASVGAQLSAFVHEINSLVSLSSSVMRQIERFRENPHLTDSMQVQLAAITQRATDLHHALESQAIYLTDVSGIEGRRRRSRLSFVERFGSAVRLLRGALTREGVKLEVTLSRDVLSPPMFPAELTALFTNLLSNAIKFSGPKEKKVLLRGERGEATTTIVLENNGAAVNLAESERWFEPFTSSTARVEAVLGQGMGMGLPITRGILDEYGATIRFVEPSPGYSTAVEVSFPAGRN